MEIITDPVELSTLTRYWQKNDNTIALVPTMGYYHAGHEALINHGRKLADRLIVSLFVNPTQFGPSEDLEAYPRDFDGDAAKAKALGADVLFAPSSESLYCADHSTWVEVPDLASGLCGASRPIHFRGVCTIVLKLLVLTRADYSVFGEKDWQQQAIIRRMVRDLNIPVEIVSYPTVREEDGLALSSRNVYLTFEERSKAPHIRKALELAFLSVRNGERELGTLRARVLSYLKEHIPEGQVDYIEVVDPYSLKPAEDLETPAIIACAIKLGKARLIDNIMLQP